MNNRTVRLSTGLTALLSTFVLSACQSDDTTKTVDLGQAYCLMGNVHLPKGLGLAEGVAVKDGNIIAISYDNDDWCGAALGIDNPTLSDLGEAHIFPGFTDSHAHLLGIGLREMTMNLEGIASIAELVKRVETAVKVTQKGEAIYGRGWIETFWPENRFPTRSDLDAVSPDHPVVLERADGHAVVVNSIALAMAGITKDTPSPFGGEIIKGTDGQPTGMLIDEAAELVLALNGELTEPKRRAAYIKGAEVYAAYGWTGIHNMSAPPGDIALIEELARNGDIAIRVYNGVDAAGASALITMGPQQDGLVTTRMLKIYSDGALGSRGAALLEPYSDDPDNMGLLTLNENDLLPIYKDALREGIQIATHAIGDRANRLVLNWYEEAFAAVPEQERAIAKPRWRIEHAQIINPADMPRYKALGVIPSMQPSHAIGDLYFANDRIGKDRLVGGYAWRNLLDSGTIIVGGSDAPVERGDPRIEFYAATVRKDLEGNSQDHWYLDQAVTPDEALSMFTKWPAYASFREDKLGTIEVGKAADFTIFSTDITKAKAQDILKTEVVMTIVDGKVVYKK